jgi:DNA-binding transcriptional MerR regulator
VRYLKTSEIAEQVGVHVNTVRLYEERGYLSPVRRTATGYRLFTPLHLEQMRLAHLALQWPYSGDKQLIIDLLHYVVNGDLGMAIELAYEYLINVRIERTRAEAAADFLERWAQGKIIDTTQRTRTIGQIAKQLGVTIDQLRNWDRNGLLDVPRDNKSQYRMYGASEIGRLRVIRMLRQTGYSMTAILRMLIQFDAGQKNDLRQALNTPSPHDDIVSIADQWLSTLEAQETRAYAIIEQITRMMRLFE